MLFSSFWKRGPGPPLWGPGGGPWTPGPPPLDPPQPEYIATPGCRLWQEWNIVPLCVKGSAEFMDKI